VPNIFQGSVANSLMLGEIFNDDVTRDYTFSAGSDGEMILDQHYHFDQHLMN